MWSNRIYTVLRCLLWALQCIVYKGRHHSWYLGQIIPCVYEIVSAYNINVIREALKLLAIKRLLQKLALHSRLVTADLVGVEREARGFPGTLVSMTWTRQEFSANTAIWKPFKGSHLSLSRGTTPMFMSCVSNKIVEWSRLRRSNNLSEPSDPTLANVWSEFPNATSKTCLSWAISCVFGCAFSNHFLTDKIPASPIVYM